MGVYKILLL